MKCVITHLLVFAAGFVTSAIIYAPRNENRPATASGFLPGSTFTSVSQQINDQMEANLLKEFIIKSESEQFNLSSIPINIVRLANAVTVSPGNLADISILYTVDGNVTENSRGIFFGLKVRFRGHSVDAVRFYDYTLAPAMWMNDALDKAVPLPQGL